MQTIKLGKTKQNVENIGNINIYKIPYNRKELLRIMKKHNHVKLNTTKHDLKILRVVPYNLLVYSALPIFRARPRQGTKGKIFMVNTNINDLYELYKFDSFLKGKILEFTRYFEDMFLGSLSYNMELQYKK